MSTSSSEISSLNEPYKYGFSLDIETDEVEKGLSERIVRLISSKKQEPTWLLEFRLKALKHFFKLLGNF